MDGWMDGWNVLKEEIQVIHIGLLNSLIPQKTDKQQSVFIIQPSTGSLYLSFSPFYSATPPPFSPKSIFLDPVFFTTSLSHSVLFPSHLFLPPFQSLYFFWFHSPAPSFWSIGKSKNLNNFRLGEGVCRVTGRFCVPGPFDLLAKWKCQLNIAVS